MRRIAVEAGEIILDYYDGAKSIRTIIKPDGSPVTNADQDAETHIKDALAKHLPDVPFIGEETTMDPDIQTDAHFWCVDPLDGTKAFLQGKDEFTVNIALIYKGKPVIGVVYLPATGILYAGYDQTALRWNQDSGKEKSISVRPPPARGLTVVTSGLHGRGEEVITFLADFKIAKHIKKSSSLKLCMIADGRADLYPRFGPTSWWDTAAAHAILNAAGGFVTDTSGKTLVYGSGNDVLNPDFIASGFDVFEDG